MAPVTKTFSVRLPPDLVRRFKIRAAQEDTTLTALAERAFELLLSRNDLRVRVEQLEAELADARHQLQEIEQLKEIEQVARGTG